MLCPANQSADEGQQEKNKEQEEQDSRDTNRRRRDTQETENRGHQSYDEEYDRPTQHEASFFSRSKSVNTPFGFELDSSPRST